MTDTFPNTYRIKPAIVSTGAKFYVALPGEDYCWNSGFDTAETAEWFIESHKYCNEKYGETDPSDSTGPSYLGRMDKRLRELEHIIQNQNSAQNYSTGETTSVIDRRLSEVMTKIDKHFEALEHVVRNQNFMLNQMHNAADRSDAQAYRKYTSNNQA